MPVKVKVDGILRAVAATPWAIQSEKLEAMLDFLALRAAHGRLTEDEIRERLAAERASAETRRGPRARGEGGGGIAVLPMVGIVAQRMNMLSEFSGGVSTEQLGARFDEAMIRPDVGTIVLDVDSPGGSVSGTPELAAKIYKARGQGKRIIAVSNSLMASAAYWIASAADEVVASPSSEVGSIGVFMVHTDVSRLEADLGITRTLISAGEYKTEANPYEPLSDEARAALQEQVDECYGDFLKAVAKHRGVSASVVKSDFGKGRALTAKQALAAGMIDRIASLDDVLAELAPGTRSSRRAASSTRPLPIAAQAGALEVGALVAVQENGVVGRLTGAGDDAPHRWFVEHELEPETPENTDDADVAAMEMTRVTEPADGREATSAAIPRVASHEPARTGQESTMSDKDTGAPSTGAAPNAKDLGAERARVKEITGLAREHKVEAARVEQWIESGASVDAVAREILNAKKESAAAAPRVTVGADREADRGFRSFGEQLVAIVQAGIPGGRRDARLNAVNRMAAASGMSEGVGSEGGFFVQPELLPGVMEPIYAEDPILSRVFRLPSDKPAVKYLVVDETSRATGSRWGGIQMYRVAEAETATAKKPKLRTVELQKKKLMGVAYITEELMQDAPAAEALLTSAYQAELAFSLGDEIFRGNGSGQMQGFLNSGALVTQAIEAAQTIANTPASIAMNTSKMLSRVPAALQSGAIWLYNPELLPYLATATISSSSIPVFIGQGGMTAQTSDTIWGRPAFMSDLCEAVGTPGDIVLVVPNQYHMLADGGATSSTSVHVRFLYDEQVLKITHRCDGQPVWKQSVTPYKGANARSPFVALATRA